MIQEASSKVQCELKHSDFNSVDLDPSRLASVLRKIMFNVGEIYIHKASSSLVIFIESSSISDLGFELNIRYMTRRSLMVIGKPTLIIVHPDNIGDWSLYSMEQ